MANSIKENEYIKLISPDEEGNISLWDKLIKEFNNLMKGQNENPDEIEWIFRGQVSDCKDKKDNLSKDNIQESLMGELKTTFEKSIDNFNFDKHEKINIEHNLIREFKRRYQHYSGKSPNKKDYLGWLSLMAHYTAPTRLLDWTIHVIMLYSLL